MQKKALTHALHLFIEITFVNYYFMKTTSENLTFTIQKQTEEAYFIIVKFCKVRFVLDNSYRNFRLQ